MPPNVDYSDLTTPMYMYEEPRTMPLVLAVDSYTISPESEDQDLIDTYSVANSTSTLVDQYPDSWTFGGGFFQRFASAYEPVHLPLSVMICLFGVVANTLNVIVLTRRTMSSSPTNILLTGLSAAQLFLLMNYLLLLTFNVCASSCLIPALHSYAAVTYKWINVNISVAFHTTALMHTLILSIFRFLAVQMPALARTRINVSTARACVITLYSVVPFLCAPTFFTSHVARVNPPGGTSQSERLCHLEEAYDLDYVQHTELLEAAFWTFGIFFKLVPSSTICVLSLYLIVSLRRYQEKKARLTGRGIAKQFEKHEYRPLLMPAVGILMKNDEQQQQQINMNEVNRQTAADDSDSPPSSPNNNNTAKFTVNSVTSSENNNNRLIKQYSSVNLTSRSTSSNPSKQRHNSVTKMLVAVALLCASVELPHGVINLLTAIFGQTFGMEVYDNLGDFFEMLTLLYSSVNFVLYCIMSTEFQRTFKQLFVDTFREAVTKKLTRPDSADARMGSASSYLANAFAIGGSTTTTRNSRDQSVQTSRRKR